MEVSNSVHVMSKPTGSVCNLDCDYCFYLEKDKLYPTRGRDWKMSLETLEVYIKQHIEAQNTDTVTFAWQGGEPLLMGIEFFQQALIFQQRFGAGKHIENTIQTNGILLNETWCHFLKQHQFLVGISIDGPEHLHDKYRKSRSGKGSYQKVKSAILLLKKYAIEFNTLTVVNSDNVEHPIELYRHLKELGSNYHQYIPLVERSAKQPTQEGLYLVSPDHLGVATVTEWSVPSVKFGQFLAAIFDEWIKTDVGHVFVPYFENTLAGWAGEKGFMCTLAPRCGSAFALESNGDIYNCDHYVYPEFKLGNIHSKTINEMNFSRNNELFGLNKAPKSEDCKQCPYLNLCNGGCPKHRFVTEFGQQEPQNYLCQGYKYFFAHSKKKMCIMRDLWHSDRSPAEVMFI